MGRPNQEIGKGSRVCLFCRRPGSLMQTEIKPCSRQGLIWRCLEARPLQADPGPKAGVVVDVRGLSQETLYSSGSGFVPEQVGQIGKAGGGRRHQPSLPDC